PKPVKHKDKLFKGYMTPLELNYHQHGDLQLAGDEIVAWRVKQQQQSNLQRRRQWMEHRSRRWSGLLGRSRGCWNMGPRWSWI
nr:hypothetical protein [Tanacetum cinerariifolium]GEV50212.1 hypothetical protein [Tanacetum cinerariifolium]